MRRLVYVSGARPGPGRAASPGRSDEPAELGFTLITKDTLKETLHDALGAPEPDLAWSRQLGSAAMELLWRLAADAPAVVIEANFRPYSELERGKLTGLAGLGGRAVEVHRQCPAEVALACYNARPTHPVHVLKTLPAGAMASYDRPVGIGGLVLVDTTAVVDVPAVAARVRACLAGADSRDGLGRVRESAAACRWSGGPPGPHARGGRRQAGTRRRS